MKIKSFIILLWGLLDPIYFYFTRLHYLKRGDGYPCIFRVRLTRYKGHEVVLSDGTTIKRNDMLVKIHLHNVHLLKSTQGISSEFRRAIITYKHVKESMPYVALYVQKHFQNKDIKGVIGITMLHRGTEKLGFEIHSIYNGLYKRLKQFIQYPMLLLSHSTQSLQNKDKPYPVYIFMSKDCLLNKYGK